MERVITRKTILLYLVFTLLVACGYVMWNGYNMDGDGNAFMDIAQGLTDGHPGLAINAYWNPGYAAVLAVGRVITHANSWTELAAARWTNLVIAAFALVACLFFTSGLTRLRARVADGEALSAIPAAALHLAGLTFVLLSFGRELPLDAIRSDTLLMTLLLTAAGFGLRILAGGSIALYAGLGVALGLAYLTKSFAFLPATILLIGILVYGILKRKSSGTNVLLGGSMAIILYAALAAPYIIAISKQSGHLTTGDSARLNYAFFIDDLGRWHEWHDHHMGKAKGTFVHAELAVAENPTVYSYAAHPYGTFPLWFDPGYWTTGVKPTIYIPGHIHRLIRNIELFFRFLLGRPEPFLLVGVLMACGAFYHRGRQSLLLALPVLWGALMFGIYFPVDLQDRYLTAPFLLIVLPAAALLRVRSERASQLRNAAATAILLLAVFVLFTGLGTELDRRRLLPGEHRGESGYDPQITQAALGLKALGIKPGDKVACMGNIPCYTDHYWARIAGAQILAEVETRDNADPLEVWTSIAEPEKTLAPLRALGMRALVTKFHNSQTKPAGWVQLGTSDFFAYPLTTP